MIHSLGFSSTDFQPFSPGRLCRGRERWINPWPLEGDDEGPTLSRVVITGAAYTDDSARDALRGTPHSTIGLPELIGGLFPRRTFLAFMEDGHPADIPEGAEGVEAYTSFRAGGRSQELRVRWHMRVSGAQLPELLAGEEVDQRVRGLAVLESAEAEVTHELLDALFLLVGMSSLDSPPARFQPAALPEALELVSHIVLLHRDKHGPALGIYGKEPPPRLEEKLAKLTEGDVLLVPFAIPPMLARWDRALSELRARWDVDAQGPFPVPESEQASPWAERRRRKKQRKAEKSEGEDEE